VLGVRGAASLLVSYANWEVLDGRVVRACLRVLGREGGWARGGGLGELDVADAVQACAVLRSVGAEGDGRPGRRGAERDMAQVMRLDREGGEARGILVGRTWRGARSQGEGAQAGDSILGAAGAADAGGEPGRAEGVPEAEGGVRSSWRHILGVVGGGRFFDRYPATAEGGGGEGGEEWEEMDEGGGGASLFHPYISSTRMRPGGRQTNVCFPALPLRTACPQTPTCHLDKGIRRSDVIFSRLGSTAHARMHSLNTFPIKSSQWPSVNALASQSRACQLTWTPVICRDLRTNA
jgi:hypothetical protein